MGIVNNIRAAWKIRALMQEGGKVNDSKPGWKTSEFWFAAVIPQVGAVLSMFLGASNPIVIGFTAAAALSTAIYTASRSHVKASASISALAAAASEAAAQLQKAAAEAKAAGTPAA